jgi:hypothetical protein
MPARSRVKVTTREGNNANKRAVNSFLSAASTVLAYSCVMYCRAFPVF